MPEYECVEELETFTEWQQRVFLVGLPDPNSAHKQFVVKIHSRSKHLPSPRDGERARRGRAPHHQHGLCLPHAAGEKMG